VSLTEGQLWKGSKNELDYYNSVKMKMSIILGVAQMTLGIIMSLLNFLYFKQYSRIICEFIPQVLFLHSVFGYMCFLIFLKWNTIWEDASRAPRILNLLTEMILSPWILSEKFTMFYGQHAIQILLLGVAGSMDAPLWALPRSLSPPKV
jgi:V-type H+-transporting ATPase subunit a